MKSSSAKQRILKWRLIGKHSHERRGQCAIEKMVKSDFKLEVESMISKDISYVTEQYVPARLEDQDWLD